MAMVAITPLEVAVSWDVFGRQLRRLRIGDEDVPITNVELVRHEAQAYPAERGPRMVFAVRTADARLALVYERWTGRWTIDALEPAGQDLGEAA
jgi:hypothetical protein